MFIMTTTRWDRRAGEGFMKELIGRLVADVGVDPAKAETAVGIVTRQFMAFARGKVGEDEVGQIVGTIGGLSRFV